MPAQSTSAAIKPTHFNTEHSHEFCNSLTDADLFDADLGAGELAVGFAFGRPRMARDRIGADDGDSVIGQGDRFDDRLSGHDAINELGLVLNPAVRMTVAELIGAQRL